MEPRTFLPNTASTTALPPEFFMVAQHDVTAPQRNTIHNVPQVATQPSFLPSIQNPIDGVLHLLDEARDPISAMSGNIYCKRLLPIVTTAAACGYDAEQCEILANALEGVKKGGASKADVGVWLLSDAR
jgi:hypothetical protein